MLLAPTRGLSEQTFVQGARCARTELGRCVAIAAFVGFFHAGSTYRIARSWTTITRWKEERICCLRCITKRRSFSVATYSLQSMQSSKRPAIYSSLSFERTAPKSMDNEAARNFALLE